MAHQVGETIVPGVKIENIPVGGLTRDEALKRLETHLTQNKLATLQVVASNKTWNFKLAQIDVEFCYQDAVNNALSIGRSGSMVKRGLQALKIQYQNVNLPLSVKFNQEKLKQLLTSINQEYESKPRDAKLIYNDGKMEVIPEKKGRRINIEATLEKIVAMDYKDLQEPVTAVMEVIEPEITAVDYAEINGVLGECETKIHSSDNNRLQNIKLAAEKIHGTLLKPGETFSFNEQVGKRNSETGYKKAPVIANQTVANGIGGGICQVATTLYNAVLLAGMQIKERHPHSVPVNYVTPGLDATVAYGYKDLVFKNNLSHNVYITTVLNGNKSLNIKVLGNLDDKKGCVKLLAQVNEIPPNEVVKKTSTLQSGERVIKRFGRPGYRVTVYRIIENGKVTKEQISQDYYPPLQRIILEGMSEEEGEDK